MRHRKIARICLLCGGGADLAVCRTCELSRKRKLRELYAVNALLSAAYAPEQFSWSLDRQPDENESRFLDATDITK